ncbi:hypothetical protein BKN38_07905 [Helicobacter sp. CLO-3]|uniref:BspA family leucine-rich repeat surface protein n=1 Tax=unclassified Helicobacter TaxID=2593540 RepID=UPI0008D9B9AC|nr:MULTISPECIES: BspA family leucine-rich repeat surface protein [unclassified Helicobacter]OHU81957.1 hypothetical protein BKN38_07905 [Helicobacter sp. CLO-3]
MTMQNLKKLKPLQNAGTTQNLNQPKNASEAQNLKKLNFGKSNLKKLNLKKLNLKIPNPKNLAFISIAAFGLAFGACNADTDKPSTNPLTDKSKHIYHPQTRGELVKLLRYESIKLDTIDTSKITDMSFLFADMPSNECDKIKFDGLSPQRANCKSTAGERKDFSGIETWDVSNVKNMQGMFEYAKSFNQPLDSWDVSNVENMHWMFAYATSFNQSLNSWNVGKVKDMSWMFDYTESFNQPLDNWDVSKVTHMTFMFASAHSFNQPLKSWDMSNAKYLKNMFRNAKSFRQNLDSWKINKDAEQINMFRGSPLESKSPKWHDSSKWYYDDDNECAGDECD